VPLPPREIALIFDLDNTLTDFMRMKAEAVNAAIDGMIDAGLALPREAVRAQEPPVVPVGVRDPVEQRQQILVALLPAAEADEAVDAVGRGQGHRVARKLGDVLADERESPRALTRDGEREGLHVLALAAAEPGHPGARRGGRGPRRSASALELQASSPADVGQGEIGIGGEGAIERGLGAVMRGQEMIDPIDVGPHGGG